MSSSTVGGRTTATTPYNNAGQQDGFTTPDAELSGVVRDVKGRVRGWTYATDNGGEPASGGSPSARLVVAGRVEYDAADRVSSETQGQLPGAAVRYDYYEPGDTSAGASPGKLRSMTVTRDGQAVYAVTYQYDPNTGRLANVVAGSDLPGDAAAVGNKSFGFGYVANASVVGSIDMAGKSSPAPGITTPPGGWTNSPRASRTTSAGRGRYSA